MLVDMGLRAVFNQLVYVSNHRWKTSNVHTRLLPAHSVMGI